MAQGQAFDDKTRENAEQLCYKIHALMEDHYKAAGLPGLPTGEVMLAIGAFMGTIVKMAPEHLRQDALIVAFDMVAQAAGAKIEGIHRVAASGETTSEVKVH